MGGHSAEMGYRQSEVCTASHCFWQCRHGGREGIFRIFLYFTSQEIPGWDSLATVLHLYVGMELPRPCAYLLGWVLLWPLFPRCSTLFAVVLLQVESVVIV